MSSFGENLLSWRRFRKLTQTELAARSGIPQPNLCAMEGDRLDPQLSTLRRLAVALQLSVGDLVEKKAAPPVWDRHRIDALVREAVSKNRLVSPMARALRGVARERLAATGHFTRKLPGTGGRVIHQLKSDLGPLLWDAVIARLDKFA
jgi:transcriptional regulator with XRE-family HTH domain